MELLNIQEIRNYLVDSLGVNPDAMRVTEQVIIIGIGMFDGGR